MSNSLIRNRWTGLPWLVLALLCTVAAIPNANASWQFEEVLHDGFENYSSMLYPRIDVTSDALVLFTAAGQSASIGVQVFDPDGQLIPDASVTWTSLEPDKVTAASTGPLSANVTALQTLTEQVEIEIGYAPLGITQRAWVVMGTPAPRTVRINSALVSDIQGNRGRQHTLVLVQHPSTKELQAGDILLTGDEAGVMVHVLHASMDSQFVTVTAQPAAISQAFENIKLTVTGEPMELTMRDVGPHVEVAIRSLRDDVLLHHFILDRARFSEQLTCTGGWSLGSNVNITGLALTRQIQPRMRLTVEDYTVEEFELGIDGVVRLQAGLQVNLTGGVSLGGECLVKLPPLRLGRIPLYVFSVEPIIEPKFGMRLEASSSESVQVQPPAFDRQWSASGGVRYTRAGGWAVFGNSNATDNSSDLFQIQPTGSVTLRAGALMDLAWDKDFRVGHGPLSASLVTLQFARFLGGPYFELELPLPVDPDDSNYRGPSWQRGIEAEAFAQLGVQFFEGLASYIGVQLGTNLKAQIFSDQFVISQSPVLSGSVTCQPDCQNVPNDGSGSVTIDAQTVAAVNGQLQVLGSRNGADQLMQLASTAFSSGSAQVSIPDLEGLEEGDYQIYVRLRLDGAPYVITQVFPLAPDGSIGEFSVNGQKCEHSGVVNKDFLACFADPALRQCVSESHMGRPVTQVSYLVCEGLGITSLTGIENLDALSIWLNLANNQIVDISPITNLVELTSLSLENNQIIDVSPLGGLLALESLFLNENQIVNISPIGKLTALSWVSLDNNQITDVGPIGNLTELNSWLSLSNNKIVDVSALGNLTALTALFLDGNQIVDVSPLSSLNALTVLFLFGNNVGGLNTITCESAVALSQALGLPMLNDIHCRCECPCGPVNNTGNTPCPTRCGWSCPSSAANGASSSEMCQGHSVRKTSKIIPDINGAYLNPNDPPTVNFRACHPVRFQSPVTSRLHR